ncbi:hypothetical protein [Streptomyces melanosporofaciens]|uniref:hypothetical protein n=1 Tax=Streptomyces melanosporofaciens TaxID=67327 RepID=UPI001FCBDA26|nr:hypothetical protein [Streptomyces melanosporofaciens]
MTVTRGHLKKVMRYLEKQQLPDPGITPAPQDYGRPGRVTEAKYVNPEWARYSGQKPNNMSYVEGWEYLERYGLTTTPDQWDRMHLIPRELGGPAKGSNFVPAPNSINRPFYNGFEIFPSQKFGSAKSSTPKSSDPGWYRVTLKRYEGTSPHSYPNGPTYPKGFPDEITVEWGMYQQVKGTGRRRSDWKKLPASASTALNTFNEPPLPNPNHQPDPSVPINTASRVDVELAFRFRRTTTAKKVMNKAFMDAFMEERSSTAPGTKAFKSFHELSYKMRAYRNAGGKPLDGLPELLAALRLRLKHGYFTFK